MTTATRRRFRFGLRFLIAATTAFAILMAFVARPLQIARKNHRIMNRIVELGGSTSGGISIESDGLAWFLTSFLYSTDTFPQLHTVDLSNSKVTDADLADIMELNHIRRLNLNGTAISDDGVQAISTRWLLRLDLNNTKVSDEGLRSLVNNRNLGNLHVFNTSATYAGLERLDAKLPNAQFAEQFAVDNLKSLLVQVVYSARIVDTDHNGHHVTADLGVEVHDVIVGMNRKLNATQDMVEHLSHLNSLTELRIHDVTVEPDSFNAFSGLAALKTLEVYHTDMRDEDIMAIARLQQIENLDLYGCPELKGLRLNELTKLPNLKTLSIKECRGIPTALLDELSSKLPKCKFEYHRNNKKQVSSPSNLSPSR